jgi:hypothetical protein
MDVLRADVEVLITRLVSSFVCYVDGITRGFNRAADLRVPCVARSNDANAVW